MIGSAAERIQPATMQASSGVFTIPRTVSEPVTRAGDTAHDAVELSDSACTKAASDSRPVREDLIQRIRGEIAAGTYLTDEKLDAVIDRVHRELFTD